MGLLRVLLIFGLILYVLYKIGSWFYRAGAASQQFKNQQQGNFNRNTNGQQAPPKSKNAGYKGGEYIDYEEIK